VTGYQITEKSIYTQLKAVYDAVYIPPILLEDMQKHIMETNSQKNHYRDNRANSLRIETNRVNEKLTSVLELSHQQEYYTG
jgi:hypothetical protein